MIEQAANHVEPPLEGDIDVTSDTAGQASAAITIAASGVRRYYQIIVDDGAGAALACYMTVARNAAPTDPAPTNTSTGAQTHFYLAGQIPPMVFVAGDQFKVYPVGSGTCYIRVTPASPPG